MEGRADTDRRERNSAGLCPGDGTAEWGRTLGSSSRTEPWGFCNGVELCRGGSGGG